MQTLPELAGKASYDEAQHRQLRGLVHALQRPEYAALPWVFFVDDDSWVNTRELPSLLHGWNVDAPFVLGHMWNRPNWDPQHTWPSGGAGMLLTRAAARLYADNLYTPACPFDYSNDITLGRCAWSLKIALVHSLLFDPGNPDSEHLRETSTFRRFNDNGGIRSVVVVHRTSPDHMLELQAIVDAEAAGAEAPPS